MTVNKINKKEYSAWVATTNIEYASESLPASQSGFKKRLRFVVKLGGSKLIDKNLDKKGQGWKKLLDIF